MTRKRIVIVGGGSAGWITAAYLNAALNGKEQRECGHRRIEITLVESEGTPRIGVGEATIPTIRHVLQTTGIDETLFMKATDATFKQAIKFVGWRDGGGEAYYHPFDRRQSGPVDYAGDRWLASDRSIPFAETVSVQPHLCELGKSPRMLDSRDYSSPMPYAYHLDADRLADYLCAFATERGVVHHLDDVVEVERRGDGGITAVLTAGGLRLEADLFVDCTGFAALLIGKAFGVPLEDFSRWLQCDRAVTMRIPYETFRRDHIRPYTTATALSSGWVWDIGLTSRRGVGYVYSSRFIDDDAAEAELREYEGAHSSEIEARRLRFYVGRRKDFWVSNCVAIGLSGGFIEPLESTGIYLSEFAAVTLVEHFPFGEEMAPLACRFNQIMSNRYAEILDFVNMHYCLTRRADTEFWRDMQSADRITERLQQKFDFWRLKPPSASDFDDHFRLFSHQSYEYILYGMGFNEGGYGERFPGEPGPTTVMNHVSRVVEAAKTRLPRHDDWLARELA